jgi:hypothetical protein
VSQTDRSTDELTQDNLAGIWKFGAAAFSQELAGAIDRVNYGGRFAMP